MKDGIMLMIGEDGKTTVYDDTYDIVIHCESKEEQDQAMKRLENIPRWIPCDEGLPEVKPFRTEDADYEISEAVLVTRDSWQDTKIEIGFWEVDDPDRKYWVDENGDVLCGVVAWMPLPKPYGGEDDAD